MREPNARFSYQRERSIQWKVALPGVNQPRLVLCSIAEVFHTLKVGCILVKLLHVLRRKELEGLAIPAPVRQHV